MQESFLHFIWRFQYFDKTALKTTSGEDVNIITPGTPNDNAGPDFSESKIVVDKITWHGHTEIHILSSDWDRHNHQYDPAYANVVLHVVWKNDKIVYRSDGSLMPTIALQDRIDPALQNRFELLMGTPATIPCASSLQEVDELVKLSMLEKALMQRLNSKHKVINKLFVLRNNDWEETAYALLAKNFGFKVNDKAFLTLSEVLPLKIILKNRNSLFSIEALLFGQAGFLDQSIKDSYFLDLKKEYLFLSRKYQIYDKRLNISQWKFLRLRPANFPTYRIAQLAAILQAHSSLFSLFLDIQSPKSLQEAFELNVSPFWKTHFNFNKESKHRFEHIGKESIFNILINTVVPLQVAYGKYVDQQSYIDHAVALLQHIPAEKNKITRAWASLGVMVSHAFDSQASIELYNTYCTLKNCLNCNIGANIIKRGKNV